MRIKNIISHHLSPFDFPQNNYLYLPFVFCWFYICVGLSILNCNAFWSKFSRINFKESELTSLVTLCQGVLKVLTKSTWNTPGKRKQCNIVLSYQIFGQNRSNDIYVPFMHCVWTAFIYHIRTLTCIKAKPGEMSSFTFSLKATLLQPLSQPLMHIFRLSAINSCQLENVFE